MKKYTIITFALALHLFSGCSVDTEEDTTSAGLPEMPISQEKVSEKAALPPAIEESKEHEEHEEHITFTREEVEHNYGTRPGSKFLPAVAIDTDEAPEFTFTEDESDTEPLPYYKLTDNSYFFFGNIAEVDENNRGMNGNAGFVVTPEGVVVIDSLGTPKLARRIIATIRSVTDIPIRYLIVTHNHPDHAYGAISFKQIDNVDVIGHKAIIEYINSGRIEHSVAYRRTFIKPDMVDFEAVRPDIIIDVPLYEKYELKLGEYIFDIYNVGPQHSYGDLIVHDRNDNVVWVSDLVFNNRVTFMEDGHSKLAIQGQEWLLKNFSDVKLMIPGHGSAQTAPFPMVTKTMNYVKRMRNFMAKAIDEGMDLMDAVDAAEFEDWQDVRLYGLNQRPNSNFIYREIEAEQFE